MGETKPDAFDEFWQAYPRRVAKQTARKAWAQLQPDDRLLDRILVALEWQRRQAQWTRDGARYIPYPATWLRAHGWEDEPVDLLERSPTFSELKAKGWR